MSLYDEAYSFIWKTWKNGMGLQSGKMSEKLVKSRKSSLRQNVVCFEVCEEITVSAGVVFLDRYGVVCR